MCVCVCVCIFFLFQILFPYMLLQDIEYSSLCCTVGPCWLCFLFSSVCIATGFFLINKSTFESEVFFFF